MEQKGTESEQYPIKWVSQEPSIITPNSATEVYPTQFIPGLTWKQRIERWKQNETDYIDPQIWDYIDSFVDIEDEDSSPVDIGLEYFGMIMTSDGVELSQSVSGREMISPARFLELCTTYPDLQRKYPIVCTKQVCVNKYGGFCVLYANESAGERSLYLFNRGVDWFKYCRFPFISKVS